MRGTPYIFNNLGRGINAEAAPYAISEGQARDACNFHTSPIGIIAKRNGCTNFTSSGTYPLSTALTSLYAAHTSTRWLIGAGGTKLFKINTSGQVNDLKTGLTSGKRWEWVQAPTSGGQGPLWGLNGTDTPQQWDGSASTSSNWTAASGSVPNGKYIEYHNNRIAIAGTSSNPSRLYLSALVDPAGSVDGARNWDTTSNAAITVDLDPNDGQEITGLGKIGSYLLVFKPRKTFLILDTDTGAYRVLNTEIGTTAHRSIVETADNTYFMSSDGAIYMTNGATLTDIGLDVHPKIMAIGGGNIQYANGVYYDQKYILSIPQGNNTNEIILEYDLQTNSWWMHKIQLTSSTTGATSQFAILDPSTDSTLYGAIDGTAKVAEMFKTDTYQDFDMNYMAYWESPWHTFGIPHVNKTLREIRVDALGQFDVCTQNSFSETSVEQETTYWEVANPSTEFGGTGNYGGTGVFGDYAQITERRYYTPGVGRAWSIKFESENAQDCQIYSYMTAVNLRRD